MNWVKSGFILLFGILAVIFVFRVVLGSPRSPQPQIRALWVTRFDYATPEDVRNIVNNVADAGFTDVFFQIRGNGTAFYKSKLEPWAFELSGGKVGALGNDPGWDPLQLALDTARPHGLRVHAYMNVLPGWKGLEDPPSAAEQLWTAHSDWFMVDSLGQKMLPTSGWYSFINPVLPEVRSHLRGIAAELCRYDVAGIHLDYIRYPHDYHLVARQRYPDATDEEIFRHADFSYDPVSQAALFDKYGWGVSSRKIMQFRCDSVTRVVRDISYVMQMEKPGGCLLTASVMGNPVEGKTHAYQDSGAWARQGLVDWVVQMNYGTKSFDRYLKAMKKAAGRRKFRSSVVVGINCKNDVAEILAQVDRVRGSGCRGFALFSYSFLFDKEHRETKKGRTLLAKIRP
ncbi:MAG: family 10 glycosylhydrolase [Verrucomicrobiota bacterium]